MLLWKARTLRPVICSTGSQNSRTVAYWKNVRVSRRRWCSPIFTRFRSAGVSVSSSTQMSVSGPAQCVRLGRAAAELLLVEADHRLRDLHQNADLAFVLRLLLLFVDTRATFLPLDQV